MRRTPLFLLACLTVGASAAVANSIFSFHPNGIGVWAWPGDARSFGMGGASSAVYDMSNPVGVNPATLTAFEMTSLSASVFLQARSVRDVAGLTGTFNEQYPRDLRIVTPLGRGFVSGFALEPLSDVRITWATRATAGGLPVLDSLEASGGLWAASIEVARRFGSVSAGARWQLARGSIHTEWRRTILDGSPLATSTLQTRTYSGSIFGLGGLYRYGDAWTVGAALDIPASLRETQAVSLGTRVPNEFYPTHADGPTVAPDHDTTTIASAKLPLGLTAGVAWTSGRRATVALDVAYRRWSRLSPEFPNIWGVALGTEVRPSVNYTSFPVLQWLYRAGVRWEQHYIPSPDTAPSAWFVTAGMGIPIGAGAGQIDYAFEYGQRGTLDRQAARERIWRQTISVVGWERWFERRPRR